MDQSLIISSLGWVDKGSLWIFDTKNNSVTTFELSKADFLTLHQGKDDYFSVVHHFGDGTVEITAHHFISLTRILSKVIIKPGILQLTGDISTWAYLPNNYTAFCKQILWSDFALIRLHPIEGQVELQRFNWYDDSYDKGYQGIVGVTEVPGQELLIVCIQRDSRPILYDPVSQTKKAHIDLAERHGNPRLYFRKNNKELWVDDYDTLLKIDPKTWITLQSARLQGAASETMEFIGEYSFDVAESLCVVARPFSKDVVGLDPISMKIRWLCKLAGQPLEATVLPNKCVIARDWKSGALLSGRLKRG